MHCLHVHFITHFRLMRSHSDTTSKNPSDIVSVSRVLHHPARCKDMKWSSQHIVNDVFMIQIRSDCKNACETGCETAGLEVAIPAPYVTIYTWKRMEGII